MKVPYNLVLACLTVAGTSNRAHALLRGKQASRSSAKSSTGGGVLSSADELSAPALSHDVTVTATTTTKTPPRISSTLAVSSERTTGRTIGSGESSMISTPSASSTTTTTDSAFSSLTANLLGDFDDDDADMDALEFSDDDDDEDEGDETVDLGQTAEDREVEKSEAVEQTSTSTTSTSATTKSAAVSSLSAAEDDSKEPSLLEKDAGAVSRKTLERASQKDAKATPIAKQEKVEGAVEDAVDGFWSKIAYAKDAHSAYLTGMLRKEYEGLGEPQSSTELGKNEEREESDVKNEETEVAAKEPEDEAKRDGLKKSETASTSDLSCPECEEGSIADDEDDEEDDEDFDDEDEEDEEDEEEWERSIGYKSPDAHQNSNASDVKGEAQLRAEGLSIMTDILAKRKAAVSSREARPQIVGDEVRIALERFFTAQGKLIASMLNRLYLKPPSRSTADRMGVPSFFEVRKQNLSGDASPAAPMKPALHQHLHPQKPKFIPFDDALQRENCAKVASIESHLAAFVAAVTDESVRSVDADKEAAAAAKGFLEYSGQGGLPSLPEGMTDPESLTELFDRLRSCVADEKTGRSLLQKIIERGLGDTLKTKLASNMLIFGSAYHGSGAALELDKEGNTLLHLAVKSHSRDVITVLQHLLIKASPSQAAAKYWDLWIVAALDHANNKGETPLQLARRENAPMVQFLKEKYRTLTKALNAVQLGSTTEHTGLKAAPAA